MARVSPELVDALKSFARIAKALADYLEAVADVEESYGVSVEELLRRVFSDTSSLEALSSTALVALYEAAVRLREASEAIGRIEELSPEEKRRLAGELRTIAERVAEAIGEV